MGGHHGGWGGALAPPSYIVKKCSGNRGLKMGHFHYTMSPIAGIVDIWHEENYCIIPGQRYAKNIGDKMSNLSNTMMIKQQLQVKYSSQARIF